MADTRLIFFHVGGHGFAVPLGEVREIVAAVDVTPVPGARPPLEGMMVYRKEAALPVFSLLGALGEASETAGGLVVVAELNGVFIGFRVEGVGGVISLPEDNGLDEYQGGLKGLPGAIEGVVESGRPALIVLSLSGVFKGMVN